MTKPRTKEQIEAEVEAEFEKDFGKGWMLSGPGINGITPMLLFRSRVDKRFNESRKWCKDD